MHNEQAYKLGSKRSTIREIFEYAKKRSGEIGAENVFDFSIGNPSVPAPDVVNETIENKRNPASSAAKTIRLIEVMKQSADLGGAIITV